MAAAQRLMMSLSLAWHGFKQWLPVFVGLFIEATASPGGFAQVLSVAGHGFNRRLRARSQLGDEGSEGKVP